MRIYGDGRQSRDFTYVGDAARASVLALTSNTAPGKTINVCSGSSTTLSKLIETVERMIGYSIEIEYEPPRRGDIYKVVGDPLLAKQILQFEVHTDLTTGLRETLDWFESYYDKGSSNDCQLGNRLCLGG
jgi:nucleoside-diphosphate-sugar epimerase